MKRLLLLLILFSFITGIAFSYDFGLLTDQRLEADNEMFIYYPIFTPWFSWDGGEEWSLYLSAILSLKHRSSFGGAGEIDGWADPVLLLDVSRFCLMYRPNQNLYIEAGRVNYSDCLGMTAYGLFDGVRLDTGLSTGFLSAGLFFTGLQYKETAQIIMTDGDAVNFVNKNKYFASSRMLAGVRYNLPILEYSILSLESLFQFDLNGAKDLDGNEKYIHSQYGKAMIELFPQDKAGLTLGALLQTMASDAGFGAAFGALARLRMDIPTSFNSGLRVTGIFTTGPSSDSSYGFTPISSHAQGIVFSETLSGLALLSADYTARINEAFLAEAALLYFIKTYKDPLLDGNLYGCEVQASLAWQPLDDLRVTLGSGLFFPGMGNIYTDTGIGWKIRASLLLSF